METYNFIKENRFSELHVFPYSKRTGTPAARMEDQVPEDVKNDRVHRLIELSNQLAKEYASQFEGEVLEIIPEDVIVHRITGDGPPDLMIGPMWSLNKWEVLNSIDAEFVRRGSWQGKYANEEKQK